MDLGLKDRVYVVTGATRGLGNAAARELLADGAKVVVTGRSSVPSTCCPSRSTPTSPSPSPTAMGSGSVKAN